MFKVGDYVKVKNSAPDIRGIIISGTRNLINGIFYFEIKGQLGQMFWTENELELVSALTSNSQPAQQYSTNPASKFNIGNYVIDVGSLFTNEILIIKHISMSSNGIYAYECIDHFGKNFTLHEFEIQLYILPNPVTSVNKVTGPISTAQPPHTSISPGFKFKVGDRVSYLHSSVNKTLKEEVEVIQVGTNLFGYTGCNYYIQFDNGQKQVTKECNLEYYTPNLEMSNHTYKISLIKECTCSSKDLFSKGCSCGAIQKKSWGI